MSQHKVNLIVHGHFYQPPREDPWTNEIEDQPSAFPEKNWNYRIAKECYGPNAYSRVLDENGKIIQIINNYQYISFNFGPTLLNWLEEKEPDVFQFVIEADKQSVLDHQGHGNAIAQVYNHVIMPLQTFEDKKTQILWGLKHFETKFGRKSEGIWLSETAVDYQTIDLLIEMGIKFIILSPIQAESFKMSNSDHWIDAKKQPIDSQQVYKVVRSHGELAVFFFDQDLSHSVSFEHLLHNADHFASRIIHNPLVKNDTDVIIIASDGEIFGHHEPFGDMCLSSLIHNYHNNNQQIRFTNFGEYLAENPPENEVEIWLGNDNKGSSWSCIHGVGRWYKNCGCYTGGYPDWTQEWRHPLRKGLDILKKSIDHIYQQELSDMIDDVWALRNDYIEFILNNYNLDNLGFLSRHAKQKLNKEEIKKILRLLEAQKYAFFMYTSCGWFFTEISGIETIQNLKYAYKSYLLTEPEQQDNTALEEMKAKLKEAKSNIKEYHQGLWLLEKWVIPEIQDIFHIANNFIALQIYLPQYNKTDFNIFNHYFYKDFLISPISNNKEIKKGQITIIDKTNRYDVKMFFIIKINEYNHYQLYITDQDFSHFNEIKEQIQKNKKINHPYINNLCEQNLLTQIKNAIIAEITRDKLDEIAEMNAQQLPGVLELLERFKNINSGLTELPKFFIRNTIEAYFYLLTEKLITFPSQVQYKELAKIFELTNFFKLEIEATLLKKKFSQILKDELSQNEDLLSPVYAKAVELIKFCNQAHLKIEKFQLENYIFHILKNHVPQLAQQLKDTIEEETKFKIMIQIRKIIALADIFNISIEEENTRFFDIIENINIEL
ncbi:MAG: DUF3536 domain-containing protein [Spirochaetes bacterium]|nr:DUF3536 domain-containing protein [Spirochaetota bacterium]